MEQARKNEEAQELVDSGEATIAEEAVVETTDHAPEATVEQQSDADFMSAVIDKLEQNRVVAGVTVSRMREIASRL